MLFQSHKNMFLALTYSMQKVLSRTLASCSSQVFTTLKILIHSANPKSRPVGIIVFAHVVRPSVRPHFSNLEKNKTTENNVRYWRDYGSGRMDHL